MPYGGYEYAYWESTDDVLMRAELITKKVKVVLLLGVVALNYWRSDFSLDDHRGRAFVMNPDMIHYPVVAVPTYHPVMVSHNPRLEEAFLDDVQQAIWREKVDPFGNWREECIKCQREGTSYDAGGVAYCERHYKGVEVPKRIRQMTLG